MKFSLEKQVKESSTDNRTDFALSAIAGFAPIISKTKKSWMPIKDETFKIENRMYLHGQIKEIAGISSAVATEYLIDKYFFTNQQAKAATYLADGVFPIALSNATLPWKIGGMILSHTAGKIIDSFYQTKSVVPKYSAKNLPKRFSLGQR